MNSRTPSSGETDRTAELTLEGDLEPPMANGEVLFDAPWQGRVFGMARVLAERGYYSWDEFRAHLIRQIGAWDRSNPADDPTLDYAYYDHFLTALQGVLAEKGMLDPTAVDGRFRDLAARPHGHDH